MMRDGMLCKKLQVYNISIDNKNVIMITGGNGQASIFYEVNTG